MAVDTPRHSVLDLKQLRCFLALADQGSMSSAAAMLGMAQPSLSENIAKLEGRLEVQLAIRGARGVQLTEAGEALARRGDELVRMADGLVKEVQQLGNIAAGPISIGLPPALSALVSVPLVETIRVEHPRVRLHVTEGMSGHIVDWIINGRLQIGCVYDTADNTALMFEPLLTERLFLVTAPDNWPDAIGEGGCAERAVSRGTLQTLPLVLTSFNHGARKLIDRFARTLGIELNVVSEIDSLAHIIETVSRASGYTILPQAAVLRQVQAGTLAIVPLDEPVMAMTSYVVRKRSQPVTRASLVVEAALRDIVAETVERYGLAATLAG